MARKANGRLGLLQCKSPFLVRGCTPVRCGRCTECRLVKKRELIWRARWELAHWASQGLGALVATLTYAPEFLPAGGNVSHADATQWRKRVQLEFARKFGLRVRHWGVAEYGGNTQRAHMHLVVFGVKPGDARHRQVLVDAWSRDGRPMGGVMLDDASNPGVFDYVAGYCLKKMTAPCEELSGRVPEFGVFPQRPPLGGCVADGIARALDNEVGREACERNGTDVPGMLKVGGKSVVLPRTLRRRARRLLGLDSDEAKGKRAEWQACRDRYARVHFEGDWSDPAAHVDQAGIDAARSRRAVWMSGKRKRCL